MKAIGLHQPYGTWIQNGTKTIETRWWLTTHRGPLLICATAKPYYPGMPNSVQLCVVNIVDCRPMLESDAVAARFKWYSGLWAWILNDVRVVKPRPVKCGQSFFEVPDSEIEYVD